MLTHPYPRKPVTNGQTLPGIQTWQFNHHLPYRFGISGDVYHDLFLDTGLDETLQQNFFLERCSCLGDHATMAYDSTTISTYSGRQPVADLPKSSREKVKKFMTIRTRGSKVTISFNEERCREAYKYHGCFALVSNKDKDYFKCLRKYRKRENNRRIL